MCVCVSTGPHFVNRKLDFSVKELRRLKVAVAGIQETKWFGQDVWNADGYTLFHSQRTLPGDGEPLLRNEGVGLCWIRVLLLLGRMLVNVGRLSVLG